MAFAGNGSKEAFSWAGNHDESTRSPGLGIFGATDELGYRQAADQFVFEYGVDKIAHLEFGRTAGHMEFKLAARTIIERVDALLAAGSRNGFGDAKAHQTVPFLV
jgi:hypothetical protein